MNASEMSGYKRGQREAAKRIRALEETLGETIAAFHVTLMVCAEKNGETDVEKRYSHAEKHPTIKKARAVLCG